MLLLNLLLLITGQECAHHFQDDLISRLETHVSKCLGPSSSSSALSTLSERFIANDFDRHQPLALMAFSNSSELLHSLAGAVTSSLFGASRSPHKLQTVDFQTLLEPWRASNYNIKQTLRTLLATPLRACPERNLFVFDNVQALDDAALPVLDVLLDPLNGKRAQFQLYVDGRASRVFDCTNSVFLFLFKVTSSKVSLGEGKNSSRLLDNWREFLMQQWSRPGGSIEEFTPQAFVGRITDAVAVFPLKGDGRLDALYDEFKLSPEWHQMCEVQFNDLQDEVIKVGGSTRSYARAALGLVAEKVAAAAAIIPSAIAMISIPAFLLILTRAKRWNGETTKVRERRIIHRRSSGSSSARRKKKKARK